MQQSGVDNSALKPFTGKDSGKMPQETPVNRRAL